MFNRRKFLQNNIAATVYGLGCAHNFALGSSGQANAKRKFFLHINLSSMCGWGSGLLMPNDVGVWPHGAFVGNSSAGSPNANMNDHIKVGNLVFHSYTKPLAKHANQMLAAVIDPRSLTHGEANNIQDNGVTPGGTLQPSWVAGVAAATAGQIGHAGAIDIVGNGGVFTGPTAKGITSVNASDMASFIASASDPKTIPDIQNKQLYSQVHEYVQMHGYKPSVIGVDEITSATSTMSSIFTDKSPLQGQFDSLKNGPLAMDALEAYRDSFLGGMADKENVSISDGLHDSFCLASTLIESKSAFGMRIGVGFDDAHFGGSAIDTPRKAAAFHCALAAFWDWIVSKGYQNDVLVAVTHEFSRSPHTTRGSVTRSVKTQQAPDGASVVSPGTDHWPVAGILALNGNLPQASRIGTVPNSSYIAAGTSSLNGPANSGLPAINSMQFMGTLFMRSFPDLFPDQRSVRHVWPLFTDNLVLKSML